MSFYVLVYIHAQAQTAYYPYVYKHVYAPNSLVHSSPYKHQEIKDILQR